MQGDLSMPFGSAFLAQTVAADHAAEPSRSTDAATLQAARATVQSRGRRSLHGFQQESRGGGAAAARTCRRLPYGRGRSPALCGESAADRGRPAGWRCVPAVWAPACRLPIMNTFHMPPLGDLNIAMLVVFVPQGRLALPGTSTSSTPEDLLLIRGAHRRRLSVWVCRGCRLLQHRGQRKKRPSGRYCRARSTAASPDSTGNQPPSGPR